MSYEFCPEEVHEMEGTDLHLSKFPARSLFPGVFSHLCFTEHVGRVMTTKDVHALIWRTCYFTLRGKKGFFRYD